MSQTYQELLAETLPARIETDEQYDAFHARFGELFARHALSSAESKLKDLLGLLIQDYDQRNAIPQDGCSPAELLQFLVDQSGESATDLLSPVFGQRSHVSEALCGKRPISAGQARNLGALFHVKPGLFI
jgi:antitoxin component HigA of HigAB toxin-antitoxin module